MPTKQKQFSLNILFAIFVHCFWFALSAIPSTAYSEAAYSKIVADEKYKVFTFEEIDTPLPNPYKGFAPYVRSFNPNPKIPQSLFYDGITWKELEPDGPGDIRWEVFEDRWKKQFKLNRRVGFRFKCAEPWNDEPVDIPDWLVELGVSVRDYEIDNGTGKAPDWDHPEFLKHHERIISELGKRYDLDPRVAWIDIGSYGIWGEWHVWRNEHLAATVESRLKIVDHYLKAFPNKQKVIAYDDLTATQHVAAAGGGMRNDNLGKGNAWFSQQMNRISSRFVDDVYKKAIITGEFGSANRGANRSMTTDFDETLKFIRENHWSFIGPAVGRVLRGDGEIHENAKEMHRTLGYRFVLRRLELLAEVKTASEQRVLLTIANEGCAPFYYPWQTVLMLTNESGKEVGRFTPSEEEWDCRNWLPGERQLACELPLAMASNLKPGKYHLQLGIVDPDNLLPPLYFGNTGRDAEGFYQLGSFAIE